MARLGVLFPGQGSQYVGMGRDLFLQFEPARACFEEAQAVLGMDIGRLCFEGPGRPSTSPRTPRRRP
jgi:[acyl-carrier-protein] S-malonyltransferase